MPALLRLALLTSMVCPLVGQTFEALMTQGVQLFSKSDLDGAIVQFESAVQLQPNHKIGLLHLANAHASRAAKQQAPSGAGGASRALDLYAQVLAIDPANPTALWNQAIVKLNSQDLAGAENAVEQYLRVVPGSADAFYASGVIQWARALPAQMRARQEARQPPSDPAPIADPAIRDQFRREHSDAVEKGLQSLQQALVLDPAHEDALAYRNLLLRTKAEMAATASDAAGLVTQADQAIRQMLDLRGERVAKATALSPSKLDASKPPPPLRAPLPPPPPRRRA